MNETVILASIVLSLLGFMLLAYRIFQIRYWLGRTTAAISVIFVEGLMAATFWMAAFGAGVFLNTTIHLEHWNEILIVYALTFAAIPWFGWFRLERWHRRQRR